MTSRDQNKAAKSPASRALLLADEKINPYFNCMNKFIQAVKALDLSMIRSLLQQKPAWARWSEKDGKNALHYLGGVVINNDPQKAAISLQILQLLLESGMDMNAVHSIPGEGCDDFPATPLWYAYTRGRNEPLFTVLLENGADPEHCMYAIAWYDDARSAALFKKHGATIDPAGGADSPFLAAFLWKKFNVAEWFLENGSHVDFPDGKGNTALFYSVKRKYDIEQIGMLLRFGADVNKENNEGVSPRKLAESNRQRKILQLFEG